MIGLKQALILTVTGAAMILIMGCTIGPDPICQVMRHGEWVMAGGQDCMVKGGQDPREKLYQDIYERWTSPPAACLMAADRAASENDCSEAHKVCGL